MGKKNQICHLRDLCKGEILYINPKKFMNGAGLDYFSICKTKKNFFFFKFIEVIDMRNLGTNPNKLSYFLKNDGVKPVGTISENIRCI